eukprot:scaffold625_cov420-Prasinococcus_capsulatus_cf.AAC.12
MEYDLHTLLDFLTLVTTLWVIFTIRTKLRPTYNAEADSLGHLFVVRIAASLRLTAPPLLTESSSPCCLAGGTVLGAGSNRTSNNFALSGSPYTMGLVCVLGSCVSGSAAQNDAEYTASRTLYCLLCFYAGYRTVLELLTLGAPGKGWPTIDNRLWPRLLRAITFAVKGPRSECTASLCEQMMKENSFLRTALFSGLWPAMVLLSEIVQTFILADFCYYYVVSVAQGSDMVRLPANIV